MREETEIVLKTTIGQQKYDDACKRAWMLKELIAPVLKYTVKEYENCAVSDIIGYINADSMSNAVPVDDLPAFIDGAETELSSMTEKRVYFDIHFTSKNPKLSEEDILVMLHIDFEVQNDYMPSSPRYPMTKRAIYYAARELASQLKVVTKHTNYDRLEKVYSIWICNERIPEELKNSVTRYYIKREDVMGICTENDAYHDLMEVVMVRRGEDAVEDSIFEYVKGVFTSDMEIVRKYVDVDNNGEVKEALRTMCGLGESLVEKGIRQGIEQGIEKGIEQGKLIQLVELVESGDLSLEKASKKAGMTIEKFEEKMKELSVSV